jgi:hypothetical protein
MNTLKRIVVITALLPLFTFGVLPKESGSGGDAYTREFIEVAEEVIENLSANPLVGVDHARFYQLVQEVKVESQERLFLNGAEVDAINYATAVPPRIEMSRTRWDSMANMPYRRVLLVFHEFLGLMGIDDSKYQVSRRIDRADVCVRSEPVKRAIENFLRKSCYRILSDDLRYIDRLDIKDMEVTTLHPRDFYQMSGLINVWLFTPQLTHLPMAYFKGAPNLRYVRLDFHPNFEFTERVFEGLGDPAVSKEYPGAIGFVNFEIYGEEPIIRKGAFAGLKKHPAKYIRILLQKLKSGKRIDSDALSDLAGYPRVAIHAQNPNDLPAGFFSALDGVETFEFSVAWGVLQPTNPKHVKDSVAKEIAGVKNVKVFRLNNTWANDIIPYLQGFKCEVDNTDFVCTRQ